MTETEQRETPWQVDFSSKAEKQTGKLPAEIRSALYLLKHDLEQKGPVQAGWRNYSLIINAKDVHHAHLNNNRPRYVVIWKVLSMEKQILEIRHVGTHGSVDYARFK
jgi:mRNA-degrading endonuclease RelE of RelBE toxin-antitoxin system